MVNKEIYLIFKSEIHLYTQYLRIIIHVLSQTSLRPIIWIKRYTVI